MSEGTHPVAALVLEVVFLLLMFLVGDWLLTPGADPEIGKQEAPYTSSASI